MKYKKWIPFYGKIYMGAHISNNKWIFALWLYEEIIISVVLSIVLIIIKK